VLAFVLDGLQPGEIAEELGITPGAVRQRLLAARKQLKLALQDQRNDDGRIQRAVDLAKEVTQ